MWEGGLAAADGCPQLGSLIRRFARPFRRHLWRLSRHPRQRELLRSFPAAAIAIVAGEQPAEMRARARRLVREGAALSSVAAALGLPPWYRRLPPECFDSPPRTVFNDAEAEKVFGFRVLTLLPQQKQVLARWLGMVLAAQRTCGDEFALWLAAQRPVVPLSADMIAFLALYHWHSRHPDSDAAPYIRMPWSPSLGLASAATQARSWVLTLLVERCTIADADRLDRHIDGLDLVPLRAPPAIIAECLEMQNCLRDYVGAAVRGRCLLFGVRKERRRVATLEVVREEDAGPQLGQLRGPRNARPSPDLIATVERWITREHASLSRDLALGEARYSIEAFERIAWKPFADTCPDVVPGNVGSVGDVLRIAYCLDRLARRNR